MTEEVAKLLMNATKKPPIVTVLDLIEKSHERSVEKGWWEGVELPLRADQTEKVLAKLFLMVTELAEAGEEVRVNPIDDLATITYTPDGKPEGFPVEIADALIRIGDTVGALGPIMVGAVLRALQEKYAYNGIRPHRHGNKLA